MPKEPILELSFIGGIDEAARPEIVDPARSFTLLENGRQGQRGGYTKRPAFVAQTRARTDVSATPRTSGRRVFPFQDQTCVIDSASVLDVYSPTASANITKGRVSEARLTRVPLPYPGASPLWSDIAYASGYVIAAHALLTSPAALGLSLVVTVTDIASGAFVRHDVLESALAGTQIKLAVVESSTLGQVIVLVYNNAATTLHARTLVVANLAGIQAGWSAQTAIATDYTVAFGLGPMDAHGLEDRFAVSYRNTSGGTNRLTVRTFDAATLALLEARTISTASGDPLSTGLAGSNADTLWIAWSVTTSANVIGVQGNALATTKAAAANVVGATPANIGGVGLVVTGVGSGRLVASYPGPPGQISAQSFTTTGATVVTVGPPANWYHVVMMTRPWMVGSRCYCAVVSRDLATGDNDQKCHFVVDVTDATGTLRVVANIAARQSVIDTVGQVGHAAMLAPTRVCVFNITQKSFLTSTTGAGIELAMLDYGHLDRWQMVEYADVATMSGGVANIFDGQRVDEANFLLRPGTITATVDAAGSGITATNIRYCVIWEKNDHQCRVHWSAPSDVAPAVTVSGLSPANDAVDIVIPTLTTTTHHDASATINRIRAVIYRSGANEAGPYTRVGTIDNDPTATTLTFKDTMSVDAAAAQPVLYCVGPGGPTFEPGAEQVHQCPPSLRLIAVLNDMLVGVADDGRTLWYNANPIVGEGAWFNDNFQLPVLEGGEITALAAQDGTLFIFKRRAIFAVSGAAPNGSGTQGGLGDPRRLAVDVGAVQMPTCVTSLGVVFISDRGIELLTRAQTVEPIGEAVKETFAAFPIVTSITFDPDSSCILVECVESENAGAVTGNGRTLVFDTRASAWLSFDRRTSQAGVGDAPAQDGAVIYDGSARRYAWLSSDGYLHVESRTTYLDPGGAWAKQRAATSWVHLAGLQGEQNIDRVLALAQKHTDHDFQISIYKDYLDTNPEIRVFTAAEMSTLARQWLDREVIQSTSQAIKLVIEDLPPSSGAIGNGKGATWVCLTFSGEPHRGPKRTSANQRGGS